MRKPSAPILATNQPQAEIGATATGGNNGALVTWVAGRGFKPRPACLITGKFQVLVKPDLRFVFTLPGAERLPITSTAGAFQVLGTAPEANGRGSGCIVLVWLHGLSNG